MEATGEPGCIQISEACKALLPALYRVEQRGTVNIPGKGMKSKEKIPLKCCLFPPLVFILMNDLLLCICRYQVKANAWILWGDEYVLADGARGPSSPIKIL
jgi:hypothetical protein